MRAELDGQGKLARLCTGRPLRASNITSSLCSTAAWAFLACTVSAPDTPLRDMTNTHPGRIHAMRFVEHNAAALARLGDMIFYYGELGMQEFRTVELLTGTAGARRLRDRARALRISNRLHGAIWLWRPGDRTPLRIRWQPGQLAGPGNRRTAEIVPGAPGHCEGHNLNAAVTITAALAIKSAMTIAGTVWHAEGVRCAGRGAIDQPAVFRARRALRRRRHRVSFAHVWMNSKPSSGSRSSA